MAIKVTPIRSNVIYLGEISEEFLKLEGADCPEQERAWVTVRQATEADEMQISDMRSRRIVQWVQDSNGATGEAAVVPQEIRDVNERITWALQCWLTLTDTGNIFDENGNDLFRFRDGKCHMSFQVFKDAWGKLPEVVTLAIIKAVHALNPQWDWSWLEEEKEGEVYQAVRAQ